MRRRGNRGSQRVKLAAVLALLLAGFASGALAESPTTPNGFSREGLAHVRDYLRNEVATGKIPGAVLLIQQHGQRVLLETFGVKDVESRRPMTDNAIFRFYSMTKPVTSVAVMMLVDEGKISLDDPLSKFIPAFADTKVAIETRDASGEITLTTEPIARPVTIYDLLRHTSGITYGFY